jgi:transposase
MRLFSEAIDQVRREEARKLTAQGDTVTLKHARWVLLKRKENLSGNRFGASPRRFDHRSLLLNWFRAREEFAAGAVEGFNLKARVTTRLAYGFRSYDHAEIALYHRLGNLPEPAWLTHKFT